MIVFIIAVSARVNDQCRCWVRFECNITLLANIQPRTISFKHSLQLWLVWVQQAAEYDEGKLLVLFSLIAQQRVGNRPGRIEPRALKRRLKPYPLLTKPRQLARENVIKNGHPKKLK